MRSVVLLLLLVSGMIAATAAPARAQASLAKARELYAAAAYDEALTMLNGLPAAESRDDAPAIALYRVLCLVAVGRGQEADAAIETLVAQHPLYRPPTEELSPRMRHAFTEARRRALPSMIQKQYADAKASYDRGDFGGALAAFNWVLGAVADPDVAHAAAHSPLSDIRTLATGFRDLSEKALAPPPPAPAPAPVVAAPAVPERDYKRVYSQSDPEAVAPVIVRQTLPPFPGSLRGAAAGIIEIVVDVTGAVEAARMFKSVHPQYDNLALNAAKKWLYEPARVDGVAVTYLKRVQVNLTPAQ